MSAAATVRAWHLVRQLQTPSARLVLLFLADRADQNNKGTFAYKELARATGLSGGTVRKAVDELCHKCINVSQAINFGERRYEIRTATASVVKVSGAA